MEACSQEEVVGQEPHQVVEVGSYHCPNLSFHCCHFWEVHPKEAEQAVTLVA